MDLIHFLKMVFAFLFVLLIKKKKGKIFGEFSNRITDIVNQI